MLLAAAALAAGCYQWTVIDPSALPPVNRDGLRITTRGGQATFSPPIHNYVSADALVIDSAGQPRRTFSLRQPMDVEVSRFDAYRTRWAIFLVACGAGVFALGVLAMHFPGR